MQTISARFDKLEYDIQASVICFIDVFKYNYIGLEV